MFHENKPINKVAVIGLGYIGLPTAAIVSSRGIDVIGIDINPDTVNTINSGQVHIVEPDLDIIVRSAVTTKKLRATTQVEPADAFIIAVPTPIDHEKKPDIKYIKAALASIATVIKPGDLIILESTSPIGTTEKLAGWLQEARPDLHIPQHTHSVSNIYIAYCPERVLPGSILQELVTNDRIIGGISESCSKKAESFYQIFSKGKILLTSAKSAEMTKLAENAFRDVNIAFANELSLMADQLNINIWEVIHLANRHPRVNILQPGPGVGGHCIAVDPWFLVHSNPEQSTLIQQARHINDEKPHYIIQKVIHKALQFKQATIACLGLSFKADIDDLRESPALKITQHIIHQHHGDVCIVEPYIKKIPPEIKSHNSYLCSLDEALNRAHIIVLLVNHKVFNNIDNAILKEKIVIDTRGVFY